MILNEHEWCPVCNEHLVDHSNHRPECPVCADRRVKDARAAAALLGWQVYGTGGAA